MKDDFEYIFISGCTNSGTTLLADLIGTSANVARRINLKKHKDMMDGSTSECTVPEHMPVRHQYHKRLFTKDEEIYKNPDYYNWDEIKKNWFDKWKLHPNYKPGCILMNKSPQGLMYIDMVLDTFLDTKFIFTIRNPYAVSEGLRRKHIRSGLDKFFCMKDYIKHWVKASYYILDYASRIPNSMVVKYEDIILNQKRIRKKFEKFVPKLGQLDFDKEFHANGVHLQIHNRNKRQIKRLDEKDFKNINSVLLKHEYVMKSFNYKYILKEK